MLFFFFCVLFFILGFCVFVWFCVFFSPHVNTCLFSTCVQVYRPLPPGGNQIAANKYHIKTLCSAVTR